MRIPGFQRAAAEAYGLPRAEREEAFVRLSRLEGIRDERGERIRRLDADLARASTYAAIAALAETVVVPYDMQRFTVASTSIEPVSAHDLRTELVAPDPSATVPDTVAPDPNGDAIAVWCGNENVRTAALAVHALAGAGFPVIVVAHGTIAGAEDDATFVPLADGAAALRRARVVIPADPGDPADAIAFARAGFRLAVPSSSGLGQYVRGAAIFRTWIERDILPAVLLAIATPRPQLGVVPNPLPEFSALPARGPRVVVRIEVELGTRLAPQTADAIAAQSYTDVVRSAEGAAYELRLRSGAVLFPDALARLVEAGERSQAARVLAPALRAHADGTYAIDGDAFALVRAGGGRVPLARVGIASGVIAA